jgi:hypothetical protein
MYGMNKLKQAVLASTMLGIVVMGLPVAFAQAVSGNAQVHAEVAKIQAPQTAVHIERNGQIKLNGKLTAMASTTLTIASWGGNWTVDASNVKVVRRFNGESSLGEMQIGDMLMVDGQASMTGLMVVARMIHDESIQTRNADFFGVISNLPTGQAGLNASSTSGFTLTVEKKGALSITTTADTKIFINGQPASTTVGLANGMYARVTGVWNTSNSSVIAATINAKTTGAIVEEAKPSFFKKFFDLFQGKRGVTQGKNEKGGKE